MSTVVSKNYQIGADGTATNNFTIFQPATPDGTLRIGNGNTGITSSLLALTSAGNLGIGTSSPNYSLTAYKAGATATYLQVANGATGAGAANGLLLGVDTSGNGIINAQGAVNLNISVAGLQRATIDQSGNLGLGVTPSASWPSTWKVMQLANRGSLAARTDANSLYLGSNYYWDGTNLRYLVNGYVTQYFQNDGAHYWATAGSGTAGNIASTTTAMTLDASGNLGVGTTSPSGARCVITTPGVDGANEVALSLNHGDGGLSLNQEVRLNFGQGSGASLGLAQIAASYTGGSFDGDLRFRTNSGGTISERARIDSSGNLLVGTTTSAGGKSVVYSSAASASVIEAKATNASYAGNILILYADRTTTNGTFNAITYFNTGTGTTRFYVSDGGRVYGTGTYVDLSDVATKQNIRPLEIGLNAVLQLQPRRFDWIEGKGDGGQNKIGFIAQEVADVIPDVVTEWDKEKGTKGVATSEIIPVLVKAIQELNAKVEAQAAEIAALKGAA